MEKIFEEAEGWEILQSFNGSPNTFTHILKRYAQQSNNSIKESRIYAFKTTSIVPPVTTSQLISHKSIKYKDQHQIYAQIKVLEVLKPYRAVVELFQIVAESDRNKSTIQFFREFLKQKDKKGRNIGFLLQYCPMGDLSEWIRNKKQLKVQQIIKISLEICQCLIILRKNFILHRDISTKNLMMTQEGVKITDFDCAFIKGYSGVSSLSISINYNSSAPQLIELLQNDTVFKQQYSSYQLYRVQGKCDVYSMGIVFEEILSGKFLKEDQKELSFSEEFKQLIDKILEQNPCKRISINLAFEELQNIAQKYEVNYTERKISSQKTQSFSIPKLQFSNNSISQSPSNSISLSDWSLDQSPPKLTKKQAQPQKSNQDTHSPPIPHFIKPQPKYTLNF